MMDRQQMRLGLVGYGEVGSTLGQGFRDEGLVEIAAYDKYAFDGPPIELRRMLSHAGEFFDGECMYSTVKSIL